MHISLLLSYALSLLPLLTLAVNVKLRFGDNHPNPLMIEMTSQTCHNLRPGRCCQGRALPQIVPSPNFRVVEWTGLEVLDVAAVWQPVGTTRGCSGTPVETTIGPGNWRYPGEGDSNVILSGANYIKLPTSIPRGRKKAPALEAQGILGLITGGGGWVSRSAGSNVLKQAADAALRLGGSASGSGLRRRSDYRRRGIISKDKGAVFAQPPAQVQWPDSITFNGTEYQVTSEGGSVYKSLDGQVLDLTGK